MQSAAHRRLVRLHDLSVYVVQTSFLQTSAERSRPKENLSLCCVRVASKKSSPHRCFFAPLYTYSWLMRERNSKVKRHNSSSFVHFHSNVEFC